MERIRERLTTQRKPHVQVCVSQRTKEWFEVVKRKWKLPSIEKVMTVIIDNDVADDKDIYVDPKLYGHKQVHNKEGKHK